MEDNWGDQSLNVLDETILNEQNILDKERESFHQNLVENGMQALKEKNYPAFIAVSSHFGLYSESTPTTKKSDLLLGLEFLENFITEMGYGYEDLFG